jgi:3-oxoacyl-[acyl-carrier-protein] synthase-3
MDADMTLKDVYINQIAAFLPNSAVNNDEMEQVLGQVGDKPSRARPIILKSNGIKSRYYAIDPDSRKTTHSNAELAAKAVEKLFQQGLNADDVGCLACGTSYPDQIMPSHGVMVHGQLQNVPPYEIYSNAGVCIAGVAALKSAYLAVKAGEHRHAVACASEAASASMRAENFQAEITQKITDLAARPELAFEKDFLRWMLSDGAGAVHLSSSANPDRLSLKIEWIDMLSYANEMPVCMYSGGDIVDDVFKGWKDFSLQQQQALSVMSVKQNVKLLNENIVRYTVENMLATVIERRGLRPEQIDYFCPHYSSLYFRDKLYQGLKNVNFEIPYDKWFTNLTQKGNTGSASIYIILQELMYGYPLKNGQKILCYIPESGRFSSAFMLLEAVNGA